MVSSATVAAMAGSGGAGAAAVSGTTADARLKPAAHEFEACLMKEFLAPLQKDPLFSEDGDSDSGEGSGNALMSYGSEALARGISERGGFGIATKIIEQFKTGKASHEKAESGSGS
jgi:flagellar protein FlgJ